MGFNQTSFRSGTATGRKPGAQNRISGELRERLKNKGDKDPAEFLSEVVSNPQELKELRIAASDVLMPYLYNKLAPIAPPPTLIILEEQVVIPHPRPTTLSEARDNIAYLSELKAQGQIDRAWAESLIFDQRALHDSLVDEAKLVAADPANCDQVIRIEGGLPPLPGCEIIMPALAAKPEVLPPLQPSAASPGPLAAPQPEPEPEAEEHT
jgi:hypothetical protein